MWEYYICINAVLSNCPIKIIDYSSYISTMFDYGHIMMDMNSPNFLGLVVPLPLLMKQAGMVLLTEVQKSNSLPRLQN